MGEGKRKSARRIVESHIWNPHYMWQFVRRAKAYQRAALEFYEAARADGDDLSVDLFQGLKSAPTDWAESAPDDLMDVRPQVPDFMYQDAPGETRILTTEYARSFQRQFGDVLWLPISPELENIDRVIWLWRLYPCYIQPVAEAVAASDSCRDPSDGKSSNVESITLAVNWSCPDQDIAQYLKVELKNILNKRGARASTLQSFRMSRRRAQDLLTAFDMHRAGKSNAEIGCALKEPPSRGVKVHRHGWLAWQEAERIVGRFER